MLCTGLIFICVVPAVQNREPDVCETFSFTVKGGSMTRDESCGNNSAQIEEVNEAINKLKAQSQVDREMRHRYSEMFEA